MFSKKLKEVDGQYDNLVDGGCDQREVIYLWMSHSQINKANCKQISKTPKILTLINCPKSTHKFLNCFILFCQHEPCLWANTANHWFGRCWEYSLIPTYFPCSNRCIHRYIFETMYFQGRNCLRHVWFWLELRHLGLWLHLLKLKFIIFKNI